MKKAIEIVEKLKAHYDEMAKMKAFSGDMRGELFYTIKSNAAQEVLIELNIALILEEKGK